MFGSRWTRQTDPYWSSETFSFPWAEQSQAEELLWRVIALVICSKYSDRPSRPCHQDRFNFFSPAVGRHPRWGPRTVVSCLSSSLESRCLKTDIPLLGVHLRPQPIAEYSGTRQGLAHPIPPSLTKILWKKFSIRSWSFGRLSTAMVFFCRLLVLGIRRERF